LAQHSCAKFAGKNFMQAMSLPQKPKFVPTGENSGKFIIEGCYPGYGATLGNAIRRVLLSSLEGAAITSVKIKGVLHEFSTIDGVPEDVVQIILNLKKVRFKIHGDGPVTASLSWKGEGKITAKEIKCPSSAEVVNTDQLISNATDKNTEIKMDFEISKGLGYVPVEQQERKEKEVGVIAIDAVYTPIKRVNYNIENMRVGKRTDYNKITLEIITDGSISPQEAFKKAVRILVEQFSALFELSSEGKKEGGKKKKKEIKPAKTKKDLEETPDPKEIKVEDLKILSTRTLNTLNANKISKVGDIIKLSEKELTGLEGMGSKGIKEIKKAIGSFGLILKSSE